MHFRIILSCLIPHTIGTRICAVNVSSIDLDSWEINLLQFDGESVLHLDRSDLST